MKSTILGFAFALLVALTLTATTDRSLAANNAEDVHFFEFERCMVFGGDIIDQPEGSPIQACCMEDYCIVCDVSGDDCHQEDRHVSHQAPGGAGGGVVTGKFGKRKPTASQSIWKKN